MQLRTLDLRTIAVKAALLKGGLNARVLLEDMVAHCAELGLGRIDLSETGSAEAAVLYRTSSPATGTDLAVVLVVGEPGVDMPPEHLQFYVLRAEALRHPRLTRRGPLDCDDVTAVLEQRRLLGFSALVEPAPFAPREVPFETLAADAERTLRGTLQEAIELRHRREMWTDVRRAVEAPPPGDGSSRLTRAELFEVIHQSTTVAFDEADPSSLHELLTELPAWDQALTVLQQRFGALMLRVPVGASAHALVLSASDANIAAHVWYDDGANRCRASLVCKDPDGPEREEGQGLLAAVVVALAVHSFGALYT